MYIAYIKKARCESTVTEPSNSMGRREEKTKLAVDDESYILFAVPSSSPDSSMPCRSFKSWYACSGDALGSGSSERILSANAAISLRTPLLGGNRKVFSWTARLSLLREIVTSAGVTVTAPVVRMIRMRQSRRNWDPYERLKVPLRLLAVVMLALSVSTGARSSLMRDVDALTVETVWPAAARRHRRAAT